MGFRLINEGAECFSVPEKIVDEYLRFASGDQIKVLLAALRSPSCDEENISKITKLGADEVAECLKFWELMGVIGRDDSASGPPAEVKETPVKYVPGQKRAQEETKPAAVLPDMSEYTRPSPEEIAARLEESAEIRGLFRELQIKLGRTIGYDGQCTFLRLCDNYGLPAEVIYMLVDYCANNGKSGYSYIEKAGRSWAEQEIDTVEKAGEKISRLDKVNAFWSRFSVEQGLKNAKPTASQAKFIETWLGEYGMSFDMICRAYEQTVEKTGKIEFRYMDKILANWHSSGYKDISDVERAEKARREASAKPAGGASYDLDKFKKDSMKKTPKYERPGKK